MRRDPFLRALQRFGVQTEYARGGGSLVKLRRGSAYDSFHVHANEEVGPVLMRKVLRRLGIDCDEFETKLR